jgi:hypothetical protein
VKLPLSKKLSGKGPLTLRHSFDLEDPERVSALSLTLDMQGALKVYLNEKLVMSLPDDPDGNVTCALTVLLKPLTLELLRKGRNVLALEAAPYRGSVKVECKLQGSLKE